LAPKFLSVVDRRADLAVIAIYAAFLCLLMIPLAVFWMADIMRRNIVRLLDWRRS
jgi:hypothetical protein